MSVVVLSVATLGTAMLALFCPGLCGCWCHCTH